MELRAVLVGENSIHDFDAKAPLLRAPENTGPYRVRVHIYASRAGIVNPADRLSAG